MQAQQPIPDPRPRRAVGQAPEELSPPLRHLDGLRGVVAAADPSQEQPRLVWVNNLRAIPQLPQDGIPLPTDAVRGWRRPTLQRLRRAQSQPVPPGARCRDHGARHATLDPQGNGYSFVEAAKAVPDGGLVGVLAIHLRIVRVPLELCPGLGIPTTADLPDRGNPQVGLGTLPRDSAGDTVDLVLRNVSSLDRCLQHLRHVHGQRAPVNGRGGVDTFGDRAGGNDSVVGDTRAGARS